MAKVKKQEKSIEQRLEETLVLYEKTPYEFPSNWCWTRLIHLVNHQSGNSKLIKGKLSSEKTDGLYDGYSASGQDVFCPNYEHEGEAIIVSAVGARCGKAFLAKGKWSAIANTHIVYPKSGMNIKFLFYLMNDEEWWVRSGSAQPFVVVKESLERPFALPPHEEQKRIVEIIEKQFAKLDEARDLIQASLDSFADRKSAILHRAFTGELTKQWRENNIIDNVYQIASSLGISEIQQTSCGWLKVKSENACSAKISCGHTPTKDILSFGEIPFLKVYNIVDNMIDFEYKPQFINSDTNNKLKSSELKPGDVIMNIVGPPLRKIALIPETYNVWNMNQAIVRFRAKEYILPKFIYYMLIWPNTLDNVVSKTKGVVGQANISVTQSRNLDFVIPSRQEQEEIVRILDSIFEKEDKSKELIDILDKIDEMKKSILARAFRGQLGTSNPTDEPAIDLLKKILEQNN